MIALGEFLRESAARRREPGVWDCCAFPAAWAQANGFPDPMPGYRGAYATEAEAEAIIAQAGGLAELFSAALDGVGVPRAAAPFAAGDIGVVELLGEQAGAVYTGVRWALVCDGGMSFAAVPDSRVVRAWRAGNG